MKARIAALLVLVSGCGPCLLLPGGRLDGPVAAAPASFAFASDAGTIQLETRPEDPYSVNIACATVGDALYVSAGDSRTRWAQNIEANPLVRARIEGSVYDLRARRVVDDVEMRAFAAAWVQLGAWARDPTKLGEVWVYRLEPR